MKILVLRLSSVGDIILTQPVVALIHAAYPEAEIHYCTKPIYGDLPKHFGVPLIVNPYNKSLAFHIELLKTHYDLVFDLHDKLATGLIKLLTPGARHFTYRKQHALRRAIVGHKTQIEISSTLDLYRSALLKAAQKLHKPGLEVALKPPELQLEAEQAKAIKAGLPGKAGRKNIAVFPGANHFTKMYPRPLLQEMIQSAYYRYFFWLLGSPGEKALTARLHLAMPDKTVDLGGKFDLEDLIYVIAAADAVITNDSGPMHIAAALSRKQIAIFGSTSPSLGFAPLNDQAVIISKELKCQPCTLHGRSDCPRKNFACMLAIQPQEIAQTLIDLA